MRRSHFCYGVGGMAALLALVAACQGYQSSPESAAPPAVAPCPVPARVSPTIDDLLARLEALKARQEALDQEVREAHALLNEKYIALQQRMSKAGRPVPVAAPAPVGSGECYVPVSIAPGTTGLVPFPCPNPARPLAAPPVPTPVIHVPVDIPPFPAPPPGAELPKAVSERGDVR